MVKPRQVQVVFKRHLTGPIAHDGVQCAPKQGETVSGAREAAIGADAPVGSEKVISYSYSNELEAICCM